MFNYKYFIRSKKKSHEDPCCVSIPSTPTAATVWQGSAPTASPNRRGRCLRAWLRLAASRAKKTIGNLRNWLASFDFRDGLQLVPFETGRAKCIEQTPTAYSPCRRAPRTTRSHVAFWALERPPSVGGVSRFLLVVPFQTTKNTWGIKTRRATLSEFPGKREWNVLQKPSPA